MVNKKYNLSNELESWHWFIPLFIIPFVIVFGMLSGNSYAMSQNDFDNILNDIDTVLSQNIINYNSFIYNNLSVKYDTLLENYDGFFFSYEKNVGRCYLLFFNEEDVNFYKDNYWITARSTGFSVINYYLGQSNTLAFYSSTDTNYLRLRQISGIYEYDMGQLDDCIFITNFEIKESANSSNILTNPNIFYQQNISHNSIILSSSSNHKFGFNQWNQCRATVIGYDISDISFYIEQYIDNEWQVVTNASDYYRLIDYDDPYFICWNKINYLPVGTYRYKAVYDYDHQYYSDSFNITSEYIENSVSGTIDNNGDIDITIDNGQSVDNIKDFLGSPTDFNNADVSKEDIENSLNIEETTNPYNNFLMDFIDGLTGCLTDIPTDSWTFKVHSWGQTFSIDYQDFIPNYPNDMRNFLSLIWTVVGVIYIVKWVTKITEAINVGDVSKTLELIEEKYSDLL